MTPETQKACACGTTRTPTAGARAEAGCCCADRCLCEDCACYECACADGCECASCTCA